VPEPLHIGDGILQRRLWQFQDELLCQRTKRLETTEVYQVGLERLHLVDNEVFRPAANRNLYDDILGDH